MTPIFNIEPLKQSREPGAGSHDPGAGWPTVAAADYLIGHDPGAGTDFTAAAIGSLDDIDPPAPARVLHSLPRTRRPRRDVPQSGTNLRFLLRDLQNRYAVITGGALVGEPVAMVGRWVYDWTGATPLDLQTAMRVIDDLRDAGESGLGAALVPVDGGERGARMTPEVDLPNRENHTGPSPWCNALFDRIPKSRVESMNRRALDWLRNER